VDGLVIGRSMVGYVQESFNRKIKQIIKFNPIIGTQLHNRINHNRRYTRVAIN